METPAELINAAQRILDRGFDLQAYLRWKQIAFISLLSLLGPLHYYTKNFSRFTAEPNEKGLLAAKGILWAAKEEISRRARQRRAGAQSKDESGRGAFVPWVSRPKTWRSLHVLSDEARTR